MLGSGLLLILEREDKRSILAILDTGSDITIIPKDMAEVLKIEYKGENEILGISRMPVKAKEGRLRVTFGKGIEIYNFEIPVLVPIDREKIPVSIEDFLNKPFLLLT